MEGALTSETQKNEEGVAVVGEADEIVVKEQGDVTASLDHVELRGIEESQGQEKLNDMKTPHMSKHYEAEKVLEKNLGITPDIKRRSTALRKMGLTEEHFTKGEDLMAKVPPASPLNDKVEKITGYSHNQIRRSKAMAVLGTTEETIDEERSKLLGSLGLETHGDRHRQRGCVDMLGVPIRRHTVSANTFTQRRAAERDNEQAINDVLPYSSLLALYQTECQKTAQLRNEVEKLRCLLELRNDTESLHDSTPDEDEDSGDAIAGEDDHTAEQDEAAEAVSAQPAITRVAVEGHA